MNNQVQIEIKDNKYTNLPQIQEDKPKLSRGVSSLDDLDDLEKDELLDENNRLKEQKTCKVCMDAEVGVVFLPCGHLVVCGNCAPNLKVIKPNLFKSDEINSDFCFRPAWCAGLTFKGQFEHFYPETPSYVMLNYLIIGAILGQPSLDWMLFCFWFQARRITLTINFFQTRCIHK